MNPTAPNPTPADEQPVSDVAQRLGRPVAIGSRALTVVLLAWLALAPTAIAGPLEEAPFAVPARIVVGPDVDGCLRIVDGTGEAVTHCAEELAEDRGSTSYRYLQVGFTDGGDVVVLDEGESVRQVVEIDAVTGEVLDVRESSPGEPFEFEALAEPPVGERQPPTTSWVGTDGDRVVRYEDTRLPEHDGEVLLDLEGPPGFALHGATLSPDGAWVVAVTERNDVVVAPADGSAPPYLWTEDIRGDWLDLDAAIEWDG